MLRARRPHAEGSLSGGSKHTRTRASCCCRQDHAKVRPSSALRVFALKRDVFAFMAVAAGSSRDLLYEGITKPPNADKCERKEKGKIVSDVALLTFTTP